MNTDKNNVHHNGIVTTLQETYKVSKKPDRTFHSYKYFDAALLIAYITASGYLVGYAYFDSFFGRLSFPQHTINLSPIEYMYMAFSIFWLIAPAIILTVLYTKKPVSFETAFAGNFPVFVTVSLVAMTAFQNRAWVLFMEMIILALGTLIISWKRFSLAYYLSKSSVRVIVSVLFVFTILMMYASSYFGFVHATNLIEGTMHRATVTELIGQNGHPILSSDNIFIVILIDNQNYYLIKRESPAPLYPELIVVPRSEVKAARIRNLK